METMALFRQRILQAILGAVALAAPVAHSAPELKIPADPLATSMTSIPSNIMLILDDSGSMLFDFMPDYVGDPGRIGAAPGATGACADSYDDGNTKLDDAPVTCGQGDPPFASPDFNTLFYNPAISYKPGIDSDDITTPFGDLPTQNAANTTNWTKVKTDPYLNPLSTTNLATNYLDRVWCNAQNADPFSGNCRQNSAYVYPNFAFPYGRTSTNGPLKTIGGAPYYYRMKSAQYCAPPALTNCASGSSINPSVHTVLSPEMCLEADLINCKAGANITPAHTFSGPRWCSDQTTLATCQRVKTGAFVNAKHLGRVQTINCTTTPALCAAVQNEGNIAVSTVNAQGLAGTVTVTINGVAVTNGPVPFPGGSTTGQLAGLISTAINNFVSTPDYTASVSGTNVNVTQVQPGAAGAGNAVSVTASTVGTVSSIGAITVGTTASNLTLTTLTVNTINLLCNSTTTSTVNGITVTAGSPNIIALNLNSPAARDTMRATLINRINACNPTIAPGYQIIAVDASPNVRLVAPVAMGSAPNNQVVAKGGSGTGLAAIGTVTMGGAPLGTAPGQAGVSVITATFAPLNMAGGRDAVPAGQTIQRRVGVGEFSRTDIVASVNSYTKATARVDCVGTSCTYAEEMTNFANWYAYNRTRINMAKTAVGRAFASFNDGYRVGFITICPVNGPNPPNIIQNNLGGGCDKTKTTSGLNVVAAKYLKVAAWSVADPTPKQAWYKKLYGQNLDSISATPLREGLSRVGQIFAGVFGANLTKGLTAADEPMTASCEPNFAILATDGYWNGFGGQKADGSAMDNEDYDATTLANGKPNDPWTSVATGTYDGPPNSTLNDGTKAPSTAATVASGTLADVAMYYYKTDLRTSGPFATNNVRTTGKDKASHQHMLTFTIGLGMDGELHFQSDYETAKSGDFFDIKQNTKPWPVPVADAPSALDDLWHAAVNGRGRFFSARNPAELVEGLQDTLKELKGDPGAGAAAATSNLQPVSGDNFAFIASYHTATWWGELSARTIDLTTLDVSVPEAQLWSAKDLLDAKLWSSRVIYTFDATDTAGNMLKHFCAAGSGGATCSDGAGLTATELAWFSANKLSQTTNWGPPGSPPQWPNATPKSLVDYVRGDASNEDTSAGGGNDLYRNRVSKLGDLVNAQPSYVRKATFNYSDKGYAEFKACTAGTGTSCNAVQFPTPSIPRRGTVFAASNDGMLHAFETDVNNAPYYQTEGISTAAQSDDKFNTATGNNTGNGVERWAYIPRLVMENLTLLADSSGFHHYSVDGSPRSFDICISTPCAGQDDWRTVLIAGLNSGGRGYYALDITNPLAPKGMWEFGNKLDASGNPLCYTDAQIAVQDKTSDCNLGLTYGLPVAAKIGKNGKWVVLVSSGYNNEDAKFGGDGRGYLYILDAVTGVILNRITTGSGSAASPSGLGRISVWADDIATDGAALAAYAGDLDGNLWRFQLDWTQTGYLTATLVAALKDKSNVAQPITVTPELTLVNGKRVVVLGTGKFIETTDRVAPFATQTIYALADDPTVTGAGPVVKDVRDPSDVVVRSLIPQGTSGDERTVAPGTAPDWTKQHGWLADLPDPGERINIDPIVQLGLVSIPSNVPTSDTCTAGGYSWFNFLDVATGSYVPAPGNTTASSRVSDAMLVGQSFVCGPGGNCGVIAIDNKGRPRVDPPALAPQAFSGKRVSWRELIGDQ